MAARVVLFTLGETMAMARSEQGAIARLVGQAQRMRLVAALAAMAFALTGCEASSAPPSTTRSSAELPRLTMIMPRADHHARALSNNKVLITGGCTLPGCEGFNRGARSEFFDPTTGRFRAGPRMQAPRVGDATAVLGDGRILFAGGYPGESEQPLASAEIFDPRREVFEKVAPMAHRRADATATLLPDGRVLVAGGTDGEKSLASTEYLNPATDTFSPGPMMTVPREAHAAVFTAGRVVLLGGVQDRGAALARTDVLSDGLWTRGPNLLQGRVKHAAVALPDGRILVVGGASSSEGRTRFDSTELMDLRRGVSRAGPRLSEGEYKLAEAVATLPDGRIVIAGGTRINVYDPDFNRITVLRLPPTARRSFVTATRVATGQVLVAGGYDDEIIPTAAARLIPVG